MRITKNEKQIIFTSIQFKWLILLSRFTIDQGNRSSNRINR
ncbi:hypothetical protein THF5H11_20401 [Vibrio jasicida]|nr:hypothetical protein THF5H11_20401 [Vibrio jasicida]CAH1606563.1 hypothetical protein THF5G08_30015 [Vibrio jasicida]